MRTFCITFLAAFCNFIVDAQTLSNPGTGDSLFPVTGKYYQYVTGSEATNYQNINFGVLKTGGKYLVNGEFQYWADNNGSALLVDTGTNNIINNRKWRINGVVRTAIPDGQGGFFIGGDFTSIGDSSRKYIAQISATGKPTSWKPITDSFVNVILKRNDTLFIGGVFTVFGGSARPRFAMYKTTGTLLYHGSTGPFTSLYSINALLLNNDTLIIGGKVQNGTENVRKYNFRNYSALSWATPFIDYSEVKHLAYSSDKSVLIYSGDFNGDFMKGVSNGTGAEVYYYNISLGSNTGHINGMKLAGTKVFAYGDFVNQSTNSGSSIRRGIFAFNGNTGAVYPDDLNLNGFVSFMHVENNKIFISGKFTSVSGISRDQFAILDVATLSVGGWQPSISDPCTALAFNGNTAFIAGLFTGMNAKRKNGFTAIEAASRTVTGWNATLANLQGCKRMFARGDSLFVLVVNNPYGGCMVQSETSFKIFSLATGAQYGTGNAPASNMNDMLLDGNYLYVSHGVSLRRYLLPALIFDASWGMSWQFTGYSHSLFRLFADATKIYAIGDSRYTTCASSNDPKRGFVDVYNKTNGQVINYYPFEGANNNYDVILFSEAELYDNRMYIQGQFIQLNGVDRHNFACVNVSSGAVTSWNPTFPINGNVYSFSTPTKLKYCKGKIWFGGGPQNMNDGSTFWGLGAIDTLTAALTQPIKTQLKYDISSIGGTVYDFLVSDSEIVLTGSFDSVNSRPYQNFAVFPITGINAVNFCPGAGSSFSSGLTGSSYQWQMDSGAGYTNIANNANFSGTQSPVLVLSTIPSTWYGYKLRCQADAAYSDIFEIKFRNTWTGAVNNNWENSGNWQCQAVPDSNTDVVINSGTVLVNASTIIHSLTLQQGVLLNIVTGVTLTILH